MSELPLLSTVALLEDVPEASLQRGQVGTLVEALSPGVYEVEFSDDSGRTYASLGINSSRLLLLSTILRLALRSWAMNEDIGPFCCVGNL